MDSDSRVILLIYLTAKITFYCPIVIITIGTIGCFCNFITFTSRKLTSNSCSFYFLGAAICELLTLYFGTFARLLSNHFGFHLQDQSRAFCKIRLYLINVSPAMATCCIVLAAMDRYLSTSTKLVYRSFATIKRAKWITSFSLTICILSYIHFIVFSDLKPTCALLSGSYNIFTVVYAIVWTSFIPYSLMLCFGFGTYHHIHATKRRIFPVHTQQRRIQRTETQLVTITLCEVGISCFLIFLRLTYYSYNVIAMGMEKTTYESTLEFFFSQLTTQLFYLNYAKSFYVYTLCSKYFRAIFIGRIKKICHRLISCCTNHRGKLQETSIIRSNRILQTRHMQSNF
ncbi:unnamed protein product [Rotaria socialis]|nr:unnamed protein product [Rotaria socialis]